MGIVEKIKKSKTKQDAEKLLKTARLEFLMMSGKTLKKINRIVDNWKDSVQKNEKEEKVSKVKKTGKKAS